MEQYHVLLKEILGRGDVQFEPRTQEYILGISAWQSIYDLKEGFPLMTTKNVPPRLPFEELFWKLRGERNVKSLVNKNIHIWTANAFDRYLKKSGQEKDFPKHSRAWDEKFELYKDMLKAYPENVGDGDLGPVYGYQWRHWKKPIFIPGHKNYDDPLNEKWVADQWKVEEVDQLKKLLSGIKEKPGSRYHILSAWNVGDLPDMALGPCPFWHQFTTYKNGMMDLTMVQRSCDVFLGVPFNIAQDSLLARMVANETGFAPRFFNHSYNNVHAYLGVPPRAEFWMDEKNVREFQRQFNKILEHSQYPSLLYMKLKEWYLQNSPPESPGNERKDHIPFILEQLSIYPEKLPELEIKKEVPLLEAIEMPAMEYAKVLGYEPAKWDSKANMAA